VAVLVGFQCPLPYDNDTIDSAPGGAQFYDYQAKYVRVRTAFAVVFFFGLTFFACLHLTPYLG
jgi:hypothetical protein